jgi:type IV pilus assembly protein PilE
MRLKRERGFTLIEVMTVVVIIGIIAVIAYPQYTRYLVQARRADGQSALLQVAAQLEKYYSQCGAFTATVGSGSISGCTGLGMPTNSAERHYTVAVTALGAAGAVPAQTYTLTATPAAGSSQTGDTECAALTLTNTGLKGTTGTFNATPERCWRR